MKINRCYGCMEYITSYPCPHCGYDPGKEVYFGDLRPGSILNGKYLVGKVLDVGHCNITYIGWDLLLEWKVVIKEFYPHGHAIRDFTTGRTLQWYDSEAREMQTKGLEIFRAEARKMSGVEPSAQVVRVLDLFQENNTIYIVMEFVEGETLAERVEKDGPLSWENTKKIFLPVLETMAQVHKAGVIHRHFNPYNVMIQPDGNVKILNRGFERELNAFCNGVTLIDFLTNGPYNPPEENGRGTNCGTWTDVYAIAETIYYTLTGVLPPFFTERLDQDSSTWNLPEFKKLPPHILRALKKAMQPRTKDRTQSVAEFTKELTCKPRRKWFSRDG